ncbi:PAS domain-containing protein [Streptomyces sp. NPDC089915]|uniref:PAS domain-containing protein n=1 Tax=Streptomyces sp. NPDC089915 TaxID=3155186 RepID=UPI00343CEFE8
MKPPESPPGSPPDPPPDPSPEAAFPPPADPESDPALWRTRFLNLLDRVPTPIAITTAEGEITAANPALAALWHQPPGRLAGRHLLDLLTATDDAQLTRLEEALSKGRRSRYPVHVYWTAGGVRYTGQLTAEPVSDPGGAVPLLLTTLSVDDRRTTHGAGATEPPRLTAQESRILALVAAGATTAAVARTVALGSDGVNYHVTRLARRLGVANRTALVARAYVLGLLSPTAWPPEPSP